MTSPAVPQKAPYPVEVQAGKTYWWCSCGLSKKQPFCDGSHAGSGFQPVKFVADQAKKMFFCGCKASKNQPFCDGGHKNLP